MKQLILITVFVFSFILQLYAQTGDSIHIKYPLLPKNSSDELNLKSRNNVISYIYHPMREKDSLLLENADDVLMEYNIPSGKKNFFNSYYSKFVIPTALISYGIVARGNKFLLNLDLSTNIEIGEHFLKHIPYDNYTQFTPTIAIYVLDWAGIKAKHNFKDRALVTATSYLIMEATVQTMKTSFGIERPDKSDFHSFPSGHTAKAFVGAHILFKEYKDVSLWIGIGGYTVATATGVMRVLNKKHWVSDVVTGAGVGILSAEVGYILLPIWHNILGVNNNDKSLSIAPIVSTESAGVGLAYIF